MIINVCYELKIEPVILEDTLKLTKNTSMLKALFTYYFKHKKYEESLKKVIEYIEDKNNDEKQITTFAIMKDIIKVKNGKSIVWSDSEETIFNGSQSKDVLTEFAIWLKTDEKGRVEMDTITKKLDIKIK